VRWYDARTRTALRRLAAWLNVPWATVANFEHLLAYQLLLPEEHGKPSARLRTAWEQGIWAAKVGATTVGVGALFAVTGGSLLVMWMQRRCCRPGDTLAWCHTQQATAGLGDAGKIGENLIPEE
jgi:hypothetical protein